MKLIRAFALFFAVVIFCGLGYLTFELFVQDGFYNHVDPEVNFLQLTVHVIVVTSFVIILMFLKDWQKVNAFLLESHFYEQDIIDSTRNPDMKNSILSLTQFILRLVICCVFISAILFLVINIIKKALEDVGGISNSASEDIIFVLILLVCVILPFLPLIYNVKLYFAKTQN